MVEHACLPLVGDARPVVEDAQPDGVDAPRDGDVDPEVVGVVVPDGVTRPAPSYLAT